MAPKKKGYKKADDDWEDEVLGNTPESELLESNVTDQHAESEQPGSSSNSGGGALLAAIKKNRQNKKKKGKPTDDLTLDDDGDAGVDISNDQIALEGKAAAELDADDIFNDKVQGDTVAKSKPPKTANSPQINGTEPEEPGLSLKSKKEKDKEKKEREKQRKKEQVRDFQPLQGLPLL